jgi:hypothetical protein
MWRVPAKPASHALQLLGSPVVLAHSQPPPSVSQWSGAVQVCLQSAPHLCWVHLVVHCPPPSDMNPALQDAHLT